MADEPRSLWTPQGMHKVAAPFPVSRYSPPPDGVDRSPVAKEMRLNRQATERKIATMQRTGNLGGGAFGGGGMDLASSRPRDLMFYWRQNSIPWDYRQETEASRIRELCNTPDAPIWMGDYSFRAIADVQVGDEVIGWRHRVTEGHKAYRSQLVRTKVIAVQRRIAPEIVLVTMESGRTMKCTPDHLWANPAYSPSKLPGDPGYAHQWYPAIPGRTLRHVIDPTRPLESEPERLAAAYLGGIYDGEGNGLNLAQDRDANPLIHARILQEMHYLGLPGKSVKTGVLMHGAGRGFRQAMTDFLNWSEPVKRTHKELDRLMLRAKFGTREKVLSVQSLGPGEVVSMQTETGNYIAWGFCSKNCNLVYMTHPVIASCIDTYSLWPMTGARAVVPKDARLEEFYEDLFFDRLNYGEYLSSILKQVWLRGEAFPLGQFDEMLGVWEDDQLIDPDSVKVIDSPFFREPRYEMKIPESIRQIVESRQPEWEFRQLVRSQPEIVKHAQLGDYLPVDNTLMRHIALKLDDFHPRGVSILMRAFRSITQEEMLNAALDAVATRLYTPLVLVRLGASASDMGTDVPWIPTADDLEQFNVALDTALLGDFRVLTSHFATDITAVFGKEIMPSFAEDFDRIMERQLMTFGLSETLLTGASDGGTYAADALNRDLVTSVSSSSMIFCNQPWRGPVLRSMEDIWSQAERFRSPYKVGVQEVVDFTVENNPFYALCFDHGMGEWGKVRRIIRHWYEGPMIHLVQKWGEVTVTPNHSVYNSHGQLVEPGTNPELLGMRHLNQKFPPSDKKVTLKVPQSRISDGWASVTVRRDSKTHPGAPRKLSNAQIAEILAFPSTVPSNQIAEKFGVSGSSIRRIRRGDIRASYQLELETGIERVPFVDTVLKNRMKVALEGKDLKAFLYFLGGWISEGHFYRNKGAVNSLAVGISNADLDWLQLIQSEINRFAEGTAWINGPRQSDDHVDMYVLNLANTVLARWLEANAGKYAEHKRLPDFVFSLSRENAMVLLDALVYGDGTARDTKKKWNEVSSTPIGQDRWSYHTLSEELAQGIGVLCLLHGIQFTVGKDSRTGVYSINTNSFYETRPNERKVCEEVPYSGWVYDLEMVDHDVPNFAIGVGNIVVHNTLLSRAQKWMKRFFRDRAEVVAEAQEHFDYEESAGQKKVIYHDVKEVDEETGEVRIVRKPKLLLPELEFDVLNLNDKDTERQFIEALVASGMPISRRTRTRSVEGLDFDEEMEAFSDEEVDLVVATQETRKRSYLALKQKGLPIPQDLLDDFEPHVMTPENDVTPGAGDAPLPDMGMTPMEGTDLAPTPDEYAAAQEAGEMPPDAPPGSTPFPSTAQPLSLVPPLEPRYPQRPPESDEARRRMPKASRRSRSPRRAAGGLSEDLGPVDYESL